VNKIAKEALDYAIYYSLYVAGQSPRVMKPGYIINKLSSLKEKFKDLKSDDIGIGSIFKEYLDVATYRPAFLYYLFNNGKISYNEKDEIKRYVSKLKLQFDNNRKI
jgi:hypothetical protein